MKKLSSVKYSVKSTNVDRTFLDEKCENIKATTQRNFTNKSKLFKNATWKLFPVAV